MPEETTLFEAAGGMPFFQVLVDRFYGLVAADPVLLPLYPEPEDLTEARRKLALFLAQYWGGPAAYTQERGHPALRMRHAPFEIGPKERDRWLACMREAAASLGPPPAVVEALLRYFDVAAEALRNRD
ncbi:MAG TPA: globin [Actinomycetota bacterium]